MDVCRQIDDIVWGESENVWNDTFSLLLLKDLGVNVLVNVVMKWVAARIADFENKCSKVSLILDELGHPEGVPKLWLHYQRITDRYKSAHSSIKTMDFIL